MSASPIVHLIPQIGETPCSEVIRDQTRFTCSGWRPHHAGIVITLITVYVRAKLPKL